MVNAARSESPLRDLEAATLAEQDIRGWNDDVLEDRPPRGRAVHGRIQRL